MSLADRISGAGPSRPSAGAGQLAKGGFAGGPISAGARPSSRNQQRPAPYTRTNSSGPLPGSSTSSKGDVDDKWKHDLFNPLSDMMQPQLNTSFGKARRPTSGTGVFGKALSGIASSSSGTSRNATRSPPAISAAASTSQDVFSRFNVPNNTVKGNGPSSSGFRSASESESTTNARLESLRQKARFEAQAREREEEKRLALSRQKDVERQAREAEEERRRAELLRQEEMDIQMARQQEEELQQQRTAKANRSTLVLIQNLVDGTTPEDVKAALGDFGEILDCRVQQSNGDTVSMELDFLNRADAQKAVQQLNGALADGKTLKLSIQERPKSMGLPLKGTKTRQENAQQRQQQQQQHQQNQQRKSAALSAPTPDVRTDIPAPNNSSKLRSDRVATYDERAYILDKPQSQQIARNAGRPQHARSGNGTSTGSAALTTVDLLQRFGASVKPPSHQPQDRAARSRGQGQLQNRRGGGQLASRLNGALPTGDVDMDTS